jgi:F-box and WD-40 domain protein CDC4
MQTFVGHTNCIREIELVSATEFLSTAEDNTIRLWDIPTGECKRRTNTSTKIYSINKINDTVIVSSAQDGTYKYYNLRAGTLLKTRSGAHSYWVFSLTILRNNKLVTASFDGSVIFWNLNNHSLIVGYSDAPIAKLFFITCSFATGAQI